MERQMGIKVLIPCRDLVVHCVEIERTFPCKSRFSFDLGIFVFTSLDSSVLVTQ